MSRTTLTIILLSAVTFLGGCESLDRVFGRVKSAPDEFAVYARAPLSLPPDYGLRPPRPGVAQRGSITSSSQPGLLDALKSKRAPSKTVPIGIGLQSFLKETGALDADPNVRAALNRESSIVGSENKNVTERILFFGSPGQTVSVIDPVKESKRIRENQALGRPITQGETPTIERKVKKKSLLEGLFK